MMNELVISNYELTEEDILKIFWNLNDKEPEVRITYFSQELLINFNENIFNKKIWREDIHNALYLIDINSYFKDIWPEASHILLDKLEIKNKELLSEYYKKILRFTELIKEELIRWKEKSFIIELSDIDTPEDIKRKIIYKKSDIVDFLIKEGTIFSILNNMDRVKVEMNKFQIVDMTYIALDIIENDQDFLEELLNSERKKKTKGLVLYVQERLVKIF